MNKLTLPRRTEPYVWVTWITKLLAGETSCVWSAWLRAHYQTARIQSDFDQRTWQLEHSAALRKTTADHEDGDYEVFVEGQNLFSLHGKSGVLSGKPDLIAVKDKSGWIVDNKTGSPKMSDRVQVMLYLWAVPLAIPEFAGITFDGKVVYKAGYSIITADEITPEFVKTVGELMKEICGEEPPRKAPSFSECRFCPVSPEDCSDRVEAAGGHVGETEEF